MPPNLFPKVTQTKPFDVSTPAGNTAAVETGTSGCGYFGIISPRVAELCGVKDGDTFEGVQIHVMPSPLTDSEMADIRWLSSSRP